MLNAWVAEPARRHWTQARAAQSPTGGTPLPSTASSLVEDGQYCHITLGQVRAGWQWAPLRESPGG